MSEDAKVKQAFDQWVKAGRPTGQEGMTPKEIAENPLVPIPPFETLSAEDKLYVLRSRLERTQQPRQR